TNTITGTSGNVNVTFASGGATHYTVTAPANATAGSAFNITVTAQDQFGNTVTNYTGTVHFTSSDGQAVLPGNYTFVGGDNGTHVFNGLMLKTVGSQTVTATDQANGGITGLATVNVSAATGATQLSVTAPASATTGTAFSITVTAQDQFGNTITNYTGTVHFTSSDGAATLPANYTFVGGDNGIHTFSNGVTLNTAGSKTVTATDPVTGGGISGSATVAVKASSTASVNSSVNPSVFGQSVVFTATVIGQPPANSTPSGTVTFMDGAATLGTGTLSGSGVTAQATFTISTLSVSGHSITAVYGGDSTYLGATSAALTQTVNQASTTTTITNSSLNPSTFGQTVTFTASVTVTVPGAGTPTGTVTFKDGATTLGT